MSWRTTQALSALLVLLVACAAPAPVPLPTGSSGGTLLPGPSGAIAQMPACQLIFRAEVASATGVSVEVAQDYGANSDGESWLSECVYWRHAYNDQAPLDLTLSSGGAAQARFTELAGEPGTSPLTGVGDEAVLRVSTIWGLAEPISALFVRAGAAYVGLSLGVSDVTEDGALVVPGDEATQQRMLVDLANLAVARLTGPPPVSSKTCELLSVAEAASATGDPLASAVDIDEHDVWGPQCRYENAGGDVKLFTSVNDQAVADAQFEDCRTNGETVLGVGEAATVGGGCYPSINGVPISEMLLARSGQTVIAVGHSGLGVDARDRLVAVSRLLLQKLGKDPGTTPRPLGAWVLTDPCSLLSATEVGGIVGEPITGLAPRPDDFDRQQSDCDYQAGENGRFFPLTINFDTSASALATWHEFVTYDQGDKVAVAGLGDGALYQAYDDFGADRPILSMWVLSGQTIVRLALGPVRLDSNYDNVAPGTPEQQLAMLRQLAGLILPRLYDR